MSHTINDLRSHLFATLEALRDPDKPMDIDRAKAVADVAQVVINSAKVEVEHMKVSGAASGSSFIALPDKDKPGTIVDKAKGTVTTVSILEGAMRTVHVAK
jgi:hypothetical protein